MSNRLQAITTGNSAYMWFMSTLDGSLGHAPHGAPATGAQQHAARSDQREKKNDAFIDIEVEASEIRKDGDQIREAMTEHGD